MIIRDVLELTKETPLSEVAKQHLDFGEKFARQALKEAGAYTISGKRGWHMDEGNENIFKSIYDFSPRKSNSGRSKANNTVKSVPNMIVKEEGKKVTNEKVKTAPKKASDKEYSGENDTIAELLGLTNKTAKREHRGFYIDADICEILDKAKPNKKSRLVNEILRKEFKARGLLK